MSINNRLEVLYKKYWDFFIKEGELLNSKNISNEKLQLVNPLLLKVDEEEYANADIKIMIYGQETWGWHRLNTSIDEEMNHYLRFFVNDKVWEGKKKSSFWKAFKFFQYELNQYYCDKKISYVWNNISKVGRKKGKGISSEIRDLERKTFPVILEEIEILNPDIVIFLTGPNRNHDIQFHFKDVTFENIVIDATLKAKKGNKKFKSASRVISKDLPRKSVRLYHPSFFGGYNDVKNDALKIIYNE
jgi:hypothetical protein